MVTPNARNSLAGWGNSARYLPLALPPETAQSLNSTVPRSPLLPFVALMNRPTSWVTAAPGTSTVATVRQVVPASVEHAPVNRPPTASVAAAPVR